MRKKEGIITSSYQYAQIKKIMFFLIPLIIIGYFFFSRHEPMPGTVKTPLYHWTRVVDDDFKNLGTALDIKKWLDKKNLPVVSSEDYGYRVLLETIQTHQTQEKTCHWNIYLDLDFGVVIKGKRQYTDKIIQHDVNAVSYCNKLDQ